MTTKNDYFCLLFFEAKFTAVFKDKKSQRSHQRVGITVFCIIFGVAY
jgi:hypothetical protein